MVLFLELVLNALPEKESKTANALIARYPATPIKTAWNVLLKLLNAPKLNMDG